MAIFIKSQAMCRPIDPSKNKTITNFMHKTFPTIKCFDNEEIPIMKPKIVVYIHALIIDSISIVFEDSINTLALEHKSVIVDTYTKMEPDSFK